MDVNAMMNDDYDDKNDKKEEPDVVMSVEPEPLIPAKRPAEENIQTGPSEPASMDIKQEPAKTETVTLEQSPVKVKTKETKSRESREKKDSRKLKEAREASGKLQAKEEEQRKYNVPVRIRPPPYKPEDFDAVRKVPVWIPAEQRDPVEGLYECVDHPYNRRGFRYLPCEAAPSLPSIMYRQSELPPFHARISYEDMSSAIYLSKDGQTASTEKGFRMARANVGVREGDWYFECKVLRGNGDHDGHVRVGWARREASLDGPVGFEGYSYGIRDRLGQAVHLSRPKNSLQESCDTGDVIGMRISLPSPQSQLGHDGVVDVQRDRIPIRYKGQLYFEQFEYMPTKNMEDMMIPVPMSGRTPPPTLPGSSISVYKNGKLLDTPFHDLYAFMPPASKPYAHLGGREVDDGTVGYYPAISVFNTGTVRFNPGPNFDYPVPDARPISERYDEQIAEDVVFDLIDEVDFEIADADAAQNQDLVKHEEGPAIKDMTQDEAVG